MGVGREKRIGTGIGIGQQTTWSVLESGPSSVQFRFHRIDNFPRGLSCTAYGDGALSENGFLSGVVVARERAKSHEPRATSYEPRTVQITQAPRRKQFIIYHVQILE